MCSVLFFGYALGLVPGGWLADRFGAHRVLTIAGILWAVLTALMGCIPSGLRKQNPHAETVLFLMRFSLGLAEACSYPTFARALANWMRRGERAMASGLIHMGSNLGGIFTPVFIAFIISRFDGDIPFSSRLNYVCYSPGLVRLAERMSLRKTNEFPWKNCSSLHLNRSEPAFEKVDLGWYKRLARSREAYMLCVSCFSWDIRLCLPNLVLYLSCSGAWNE
jgi:MFS family permease